MKGARVILRRIDQYSPSVRVRGGVSAKGKTQLMFYTSDLNAKKYVNRSVLGARNRDWTFVHGGIHPQGQVDQ